jgi:hypothetical protein
VSDLRFLEQLGAEFKRIDPDGSTIQTGRRRRGPRWARARRGALEAAVGGLSLLLVVGVALVVFNAHGRRTTVSAATGRTIRIVFIASPLPGQRVPLVPAAERSIAPLRLRLDSFFHHVKVSGATQGPRFENGVQRRGYISGGEVAVVARGAPPGSRARIEALAAPGQLEFYDWEANLLLPDGKTVASALDLLPPGYQNNPSLLSSDQRLALQISQGAGAPGAGSLSLYDAVKLASKQPAVSRFAPAPGTTQALQGSKYYMFGAPGSATCRIAGKAYGYSPRPTEHCLLSGPTTSLASLYTNLPVGVSRSQGQVLTVPQGTTVLQATRSKFSALPKVSDPSARFYVLSDNAALSRSDITNPQQSTDPSGTPDVSFGFTTRGGTEFQRMTGQVARRGEQVSALDQTPNQHFAVALDGQLVTVPQIDFKQYPNGVSGQNGADITGGFTTQSARTLAALLRFGPLPVNLEPR